MTKLNILRLPSSVDKNNDTKQLGTWICTQIISYGKKKKIMKINYIYNIWTEFINNDKYKQYFKFMTNKK
jgi:hypothetical protein